MMLRITTLVENSKGENPALEHEHGLSFFIEREGHKLLFDTGQSDAYISTVTQVVLSHGHYDHSGGLTHLSETTSDFELILGRGFFDKKYGYKKGSQKYIGNDFDENFLRERGIEYRFVRAPKEEIAPGIYVLTDFPRAHGDEVINPRLKVMREGEMRDDPFTDEVLLAIDSPKGLVIILGCSHPGMRNMLDAVKSRLGGRIYAVFGGTHLMEAGEKRIEDSVDYLRKEGIEVIGVSHCTGEKAVSRLSRDNEGFFLCTTGSSLTVE